ncbi:hypothetical protein CDD83_6167 [Cordyceps sp. RAO-2017]|nr:hypothetical protein CDD83_6167 [Cordyceps sp. RAO-2017]
MGGDTGIETSAYGKVSELVRSGIDEEIRNGADPGDNTLNLTLQSFIHALTYRYANTTVPLLDIEAELHDAWYVCIQAAKHMHCSNHKQDALVRCLAAAKSMGHLRRPQAALGGSGADPELILFSDRSSFWADLPLFGTDLVREWTERYYSNEHYDPDQRSYLAAFVGRLLSVGIHRGPADCLLSLLRETLETPRPLVSAPSADGDGSSGTKTAPVVEDLLRALQQLFHHVEGAVFMIRYHCSPNNSLVPCGGAQVSGLGELALQSGTVRSAGFSPERWTFWARRLEELARCDVESIAGNADACLLELNREVDGKVGKYGRGS